VVCHRRWGCPVYLGIGVEDAVPGQEGVMKVVVVDVSNSPSFEDAAVLEFFETSTRNLLAAEAAAGVGHPRCRSWAPCGCSKAATSGRRRPRRS
jgi:hypothetical protein